MWAAFFRAVRGSSKPSTSACTVNMSNRPYCKGVTPLSSACPDCYDCTSHAGMESTCTNIGYIGAEPLWRDCPCSPGRIPPQGWWASLSSVSWRAWKGAAGAAVSQSC